MLALASAILLILAFPDFDYWLLAPFALAPMMWAVQREKESTSRSFIVGWTFGTAFFFGTCWWLTYAPITYAGFPPILAYFLLFCVCSVAGLFPALFAGISSVLLRRFGSLGFLAVPFIWVFTEFLRYWITGNNWNALGYSQAFATYSWLKGATIGGVHLLSFYLAALNGLVAAGVVIRTSKSSGRLQTWLAFSGLAFICNLVFGAVLFLSHKGLRRLIVRTPAGRKLRPLVVTVFVFGLVLVVLFAFVPDRSYPDPAPPLKPFSNAYVVALQPNVPMSGLDLSKWSQLRTKHVQLAENALTPDFSKAIEAEIAEFSYEDRSERLKELIAGRYKESSKLIILPESPMNFMYETDRETREFIDGFAKKNNVSVLFNSAEPDAANGKFFNSAVMVGPQGGEIAQYDKIYLLPFGEAVPFPLESMLPGFVGNFSYGREYDLLPVGDAKAGVMICFESHFGSLSREYVRNGADAIIEMTNDGYLGPTPVLKQHLANAVFRAVETNRPVLRVTNVGITAYINERGEVLDQAQPYTEDTRVWSVGKSDGSQTLYVRFGDWFAWLCSLVTILLLLTSLVRKRQPLSMAI